MHPEPCTLVHIAMLLHKSVEFDSRVRREASALAQAGYRVTIIELAPVAAPASGGAALLDGFERRSCLPPAWMRRRLPFHLYRLAFLAWFVGAIVRLRPDVVHAHDAAMLLPGALGASWTGALLVYDSHELATSVPYRERAWAWFVAAIERLALPRCAAVITVSDGIAEQLRRRYRLREQPTVVRNVTALRLRACDRSARPATNQQQSRPADHRSRPPGHRSRPADHRSRPPGRPGLRARLEIGAETPLVLHQGAPAPDRGCELLIVAIERLPGVHLVFLGDPESSYGAGLRRLVHARALEDRVSFLASVPLEELLSQTAQADVGVTLLQDTCENHRLALPNKLFEYIAARVPVVASALPETRNLVERHGVGWCVPPGDPAALAETLRLALEHRSDPALSVRLDEAAAELSWERERERLIGLYERLAAPPAPAGVKSGPPRAGACATPEPAPVAHTGVPSFAAPAGEEA